MIIPLVVAVLYYWMIFFLWMNMICCTLKHVWSSVFLRKTIQNGKRPLTVCYLPLVSDLRTSLGHYRHLCFSGHGFRAWAWLNNFIMTFTQTYFIFMMTSSVPHHRMNYAHCQYAHCWFISAFITSISDCLLSQQSQISSQMWLINLFSDCNWTTTALLHQWCPWCPAHSVLVIWM